MVSGRRALSTVSILALSMLLGILGGNVLGAAILSFGGLIGRSGNTGEEFVGYWNVDTVWPGCLYGGLFGGLAAPLAYLTLIHKIGLRKALVPAAIGTLIGGLIGAIVNPPAAAFAGIAGFFMAIKRAVDNASHPKQTSGESHS
jgi:hypothetical protein